MPITVAGTTITFNDSTTQSTSAIPSSISAIGSVVCAACASASNLLPGNTVAGTDLYYASTITSVTSNGILFNGTVFTIGSTYFTQPAAASGYLAGYIQREVSGNTGYLPPQGHTQLSGTWRVLWFVRSRTSVYDSGYNYTTIRSPLILAQRIS